MTTPECTNCQELQTKLDNLQGEMDRVEIALDYLEEESKADEKSTSKYIETLKTTVKVRDKSLLVFQIFVLLLAAVIAYMFIKGTV